MIGVIELDLMAKYADSYKTVVNWQNYIKDLHDKHVKNEISLLILSKKCEYDLYKQYNTWLSLWYTST